MVTIQFSKENYIYGSDTVISGTVYGLEKESEAIEFVTNSGFVWDETTSLSPEGDEYKNIRSEKMDLYKNDGYNFSFKLEYPNFFGAGIGSINRYTNICTFIKVLGHKYETIVPINWNGAKGSQIGSKSCLDKISEENKNDIHIEEDLSLIFKNRNLSIVSNPDIITVPWDQHDTINKKYYYSKVANNLFFKAGHITYIYNLNYWFIFIAVIEAVIAMIAGSFWPQENTKYVYGYGILPSIWFFLIISQSILRTDLLSSGFYIKKKGWGEVHQVFQNESFCIGDIFDMPGSVVDNPLTNARGEIDAILQVYFRFTTQEKHPVTHFEPIDLYRAKTRFDRVSELMDIEIFPTQFMRENFQYLEKLEDIGIFYGINVCIQYDEYPDKTLTYNIDRYIY